MDDFEARWKLASAQAATGTVAALVVRVGDGAHETPARVELSPEGGVHGDRWRRAEAPNPEAQISVIDRRVVEVLLGGDRSRLHVPGDNVVVDLDLDAASLPIGTKLRFGSALVEVTPKAHTGCAKFRARLGDDAFHWVQHPDHVQRRLRGLYVRVLVAGTVSVGDRVARAG